MSLWLCIRFPRLALESLSKDDEHPVVVLERQRVTAANDEAMVAGVREGQSASTVRALIANSALVVLDRDKKEEQRNLERLQRWAYSVTPTLETWQTNALQLEVGGCLRLHGNLDPLIDRLQQALTHRGFSPRFGTAANRTAAWLLSYRDDPTATHMDQPLTARIGPLPLSLLPRETGGDHCKAVASLARAGINDFDALLKLPSDALGRRCGKGFQQWLASAVAGSDEASRDYRPPPVFYDALWFGFEIRHTEELQPAMTQLLDGFCRFLRNTQLDTGTIEWQLLRMRGDPERFTVSSSEAHNDPEIWLELSGLRLERLTIGDDIEGLALNVAQLAEAQTQSSDLFNDSRASEPLHTLLDRLRSRLGLQSVSQISLREAHLPEHSQYLSQQWEESGANPTPLGQRPFWLLAEPQPVHQEQGTLFWNGPLEMVYGPERIEDNWWQQPTSRDYYIARNPSGQPLWLYQDRRNRRWYVQGVLP